MDKDFMLTKLLFEKLELLESKIATQDIEMRELKNRLELLENKNRNENGEYGGRNAELLLIDEDDKNINKVTRGKAKDKVIKEINKNGGML